jgi:hypothetical protein
VVPAAAVIHVPPKTREFERDMQMLEAEIKRLEAEYNMFFAGRLPRLPWETRKQVEALVKRYDRLPSQNTADRFRFSTLQARFVKFCELWEKQLKAKEEGRALGGRPQRSVAAVPPPAPAARTAEPRGEREGLVHESKLRDPAQDPDRLKELYQRLAEARSKAGESPIPFDRFAQVVRAQVAKHGGDGKEVNFRVSVKEGKVTLSATKAEGE